MPPPTGDESPQEKARTGHGKEGKEDSPATGLMAQLKQMQIEIVTQNKMNVDSATGAIGRGLEALETTVQEQGGWMERWAGRQDAQQECLEAQAELIDALQDSVDTAAAAQLEQGEQIQEIKTAQMEQQKTLLELQSWREQVEAERKRSPTPPGDARPAAACSSPASWRAPPTQEAESRRLRTVELGGLQRDTPTKDMVRIVKSIMETQEPGKVEEYFGEGYTRGSRAFALMRSSQEMWTFLKKRAGKGRILTEGRQLYTMRRPSQEERAMGAILGRVKRALCTALGRDLTEDEWCSRSGKFWHGSSKEPVGGLAADRQSYSWDLGLLAGAGLEEHKENLLKAAKSS